MSFFDLERLLGTRRAEAVFLALAGAASLAYRGWEVLSDIASGIPATSHISYDGVYYAQIARNMLSGAGPGWEAMVFPILQPALVAAVSAVTGVDNLSLLARCVNLAAGALIVVPVYYLAKDIFGVRAAAASVLILIPYPQLAAISSGDTAEALYSFLLYLSLFGAYHALKGQKSLHMFLAGAGLGAAYLARPEGLMVFEVFAALAVWRFLGPARSAGLRHAALRLCLLVAGFAVVALPYISFLADSYGRVVLSPKLPYESVVMKYKVLGEPLRMDEVEGITASGRPVWQEKGGFGLVVGYFKNEPAKCIRIYLSNLASELPWRVMNSTHLVGYPIVYPLYLWIPAIIGFAVLAARSETRWQAVLIWAPFVNLFVYPVFTKGFWIYHVPYVPGLVILAAGGCLYLSARIRKHAGVYVPLLLALTVFSMGYSSYVKITSRPESSKIVNYRTTLSDEAIKAGEQARAYLGGRNVYVMQWSRLVYYLGGRWVNMPAVMPARAVEYGRLKGADYIVEELVGDRAYEGPCYYGMPGLSLAYRYSSPVTPYVVLVWKIEKGTRGGAAGADGDA